MPCAGKKFARIGPRPRDSSSSRGRRPDLDPRRGEKRVGTCPSVGVIGAERSGRRLSPIRRLGPVLQIEVLDACEGKRSLATKRLICGRTECVLDVRIRLRRPQKRLAWTMGGRCRAAARDFLSGGIVGIRLGERLQDREAVGTRPKRCEIKDLNSGCPGGAGVFLTRHANGERG